MKNRMNFRFLWIAAISLILLAFSLIFLVGMAAAQGNPLNPDAYVTLVQEVNPFFTLKSLILPDGSHLIAQVIKGPPTPPGGAAAEKASVAGPLPASTLVLSEVPTFKWVMGCSAVSGSMVSGYYDRSGFANIYTGPTNAGVYPLVEDVSWGNWVDTAGSSYPNNPLIASHNGLDGRSTRGSIDDYWVSYGSSASDPYIPGGWAQHTWGTAISDYMKTSQSAYGNTDGATTFYGYGSSTKLTCSAMVGGGISQYDGTYGRKLFYEARGYSVTDCYAQATDNIYAGGFSLANFKAEIDAGRPVFLNLAGHSIVGVGYDTASTTIFVHDTWDNNTHNMPWGGSYAGMALQSVSIVNLATTGAPAAFSKSNPADTAAGQATSLTLRWNATSPATSYEYCYATATGCTNWTTVGNTTSVNISGLANSKSYFWQVRAWNGSSGPTQANSGTYWSFTTQAAPVLTTITVSPTSASVQTGKTQQFRATGYDQYGKSLSPQPTFTWSVSGGGTISTSGLFTAGSTAGGPFTVTAASGSVAGTASVTVTGAPPDFSITVSPSSQSVRRGSTATYTVTIKRLNGFSGAVTLSLSGQPSGSTVTFTPNNTTGNSSTLKVVTLSSTQRKNYSLTIKGVSGSLSHTYKVSLSVTN
jgi:hypothetical protein